MKDILGKYVRTSSGKGFVYGRIGDLELYMYPEDDPTNVNETNLLRLLSELDKIETDYHSNCDKVRKELLSLSPSVAKQYKPEGLVKEEEETRRRPLELLSQDPEIQQMLRSGKAHLEFLDFITKVHKKLTSRLIGQHDFRMSVEWAVNELNKKGIEDAYIKIAGIAGDHPIIEEYYVGNLKPYDYHTHALSGKVRTGKGILDLIIRIAMSPERIEKYFKVDTFFVVSESEGKEINKEIKEK